MKKAKTGALAVLDKYLIYLGVFLTPLFFLSLTQNVLGYAKQYFLLVVMVLAFVVFLAKHLVWKKFSFRPIDKKFYYFAFFLLISFALSVFLSLWQNVSFWGLPLTISDSFVTFLVFLIFAFLIPNVLQTKEELFILLKLLLVSAGLVCLFSLFQLYGIFILPFNFAQISSFSLVGSIFGASIFAAALLPLCISLIFVSQKKWKITFSLIALIFFLNILLIDFKDSWIVLFFAVFIALFFSTRLPDKKINWVWSAILMFLMVFSLFFIFFRLPLPGFPNKPLEVSLSSGSEYYIISKIFDQGGKEIIFGTGPSTFIFDYSLYRSPLLNQTIFWGTRFQQGNSTFLDWIVTKGALGVLSLLLFWGLIVFVGLKNLNKNISEKNSWIIFLGVFSACFALIVAHFVYPLSFSLLFLFWLLVGVFLAFTQPKIKNIQKLNSRFHATLSFSLILILVLGLALLLFQGQKYLAEIKYFNSLEATAKGDIEQAINQLSLAKSSNPSLDIYYRELGQLYLTQANIFSKGKGLVGQEKRDLIQETLKKAIENLNKAVEIAPFNVANWNVRGYFYRNLVGVEGAGQLSLDSYRKAVETEPYSPFSYGELARVNILMSQDYNQKGQKNLMKEALKRAEDNLNKAIKLKPGYAPAHYLLAVVYDQQGEIDKAIVNLENTKTISPKDVGLAFQLGVLYWRSGDLDKAQAEFERAVSLKPMYSNAKYMLALVYNFKGQIENTKQLFEEIFENNPDNIQVKRILENINQGLPALEGIEVDLPPIQQGPPEIK
jgi:Tfp pilus assembly protein PilF